MRMDRGRVVMIIRTKVMMTMVIMMMAMTMMMMMIDLNNFDSHEEGEGERGNDHEDRGDGQQVREDSRALFAS